MKQKEFTEQDSLELITQMIQQSKRNMKVGNGNILLCYGYPAVILSVVVYFLVHTTGNSVWAALWFLMFTPSFWIAFRKKIDVSVITHMDKAINSTWRILGQLFFLTVIGLALFGYLAGKCNFGLMLPLSLLYAGIGVAITGIISDFKLMVYSPLVAFAISIYMLASMVTGKEVSDWWNLLFGVSFLVMMIIPGHSLNRKMLTSC